MFKGFKYVIFMAKVGLFLNGSLWWFTFGAGPNFNFSFTSEEHAIANAQTWLKITAQHPPFSISCCTFKWATLPLLLASFSLQMQIEVQDSFIQSSHHRLTVTLTLTYSFHETFTERKHWDTTLKPSVMWLFKETPFKAAIASSLSNSSAWIKAQLQTSHS